jgi:hypothetical protein
MRRKSMLLALAVAVLLAGTAAGTLALLVRQEPAFYLQRAVPPGQARITQSRKFTENFFRVLNAFTNGDGFNETFTEEQVNSYFQETFIASGFAKSLPKDISEPRLAIEPERIRLAFRYGSPPWSSIITVDWRVWLAPKEPNVVVLELQGLHAGALPISAQSLLEQISDIGRRNNVDVAWYRHNGNPVALLRFPNDTRSGVQLLQLELGSGKLTLVGRALDNMPHAASARTGLTPHAN